jgi:hypothetical protein
MCWLWVGCSFECAGREVHRADLEAGLRSLGVDAPLLTVGPERVHLSGTSGIEGLDDFDLHHRPRSERT